MVKSYRVFTFAPPAAPGARSATWINASSRAVTPPLPPATLDAAAHQLSLLYQNVIFDGDNEQDEWADAETDADDATIEWPPTNPAADASTRLNVSADASTRLNVSADASTRLSISAETTASSFDITGDGDGTTMLSEGSSISRFPVFTFNLATLAALTAPPRPPATATFLLGVLEAEGPNDVMVQTGPHAGREVALLKLIVGDEHGAVAKLVAWRETAERWGGAAESDTDSPALRRGDIVLFEHVRTAGPAALTASPALKSHAQLCFRTLPRTHGDARWRPDLRLGDSVPAVRKVREVVRWMESMAGIRAR